VVLNGATVTYAGADTGTVDANNNELYTHTATTDTTADTGGLTVNPPAPVNHAPGTPTFTPIAQSGNNTAPLGNFTATDPDAGDTVSYYLKDTDDTLKSTIGGVSIDAATGALSATAGTSETINVVAEDDHGAVSDEATFGVVVDSSGNHGISITATPILSTNNIEAGLAGGDTLNGSNGADYLFGGTADDILIGNGGADWLSGGTGNDHFHYVAASDSTHTTFDTIADFGTSGGNSDMIDFAGLGFSSAGVVGNLGATTTLAAHGIGWVASGGNTILYAHTGSGTEATATGANVMEIHLNGFTSDLTGHFQFV
jgi:Ca2+-binding RTX toxin-like protein